MAPDPLDSPERLRIQAAVEAAAEPQPMAAEVPDEALTLLHAAVDSIGNTFARPTGVAPILGAGVVATVLNGVRSGRKEGEPAPGTRIDTKG